MRVCVRVCRLFGMALYGWQQRSEQSKWMQRRSSKRVLVGFSAGHKPYK